MPLSDQVVALLLAQDGLVTRRQLLEADVHPSTIDRWLTSGVLERALRGVYRLRGAVRPPRQHIRAVALRVRRGRLTGDTLLALHGVEGCDLTATPFLTVPPMTHVHGIDARIVHREVAPADRDTVAGMAAVRPARAIVDAAPAWDDERLLRAVDAARWNAGLTVPRLVACARRIPQHRGAARVLAVYDAGALAAESQGERQLDRFLGDLAPRFRHQADDVVPGRRFDRYCDAADLALEYLGRRHHTGAVDMDADRDRELGVLAAGTAVVGLTHRMITRDAARTSAHLRAVLDRRLAERGTGPVPVTDPAGGAVRGPGGG